MVYTGTLIPFSIPSDFIIHIIISVLWLVCIFTLRWWVFPILLLLLAFPFCLSSDDEKENCFIKLRNWNEIPSLVDSFSSITLLHTTYYHYDSKNRKIMNSRRKKKNVSISFSIEIVDEHNAYLFHTVWMAFINLTLHAVYCLHRRMCSLPWAFI